MTLYTSSKTVTFTRPFTLNGLDGMQPAGTYSVETDMDLLPDVSITAYRRIATWLRLPALSAAAGMAAALSQIVSVDPVELDAALARDAGVQAKVAKRLA